MCILIYPDRHKRALDSISYALTLQYQPDVWCDLGTVLSARLTSYERSCLLTSVASSTETDHLIEVFEAIVPARLVGSPLPVFSDIEDEAVWWADMASISEIRAWLAVCFNRLPLSEQAAFIDAAKRRAVQ